MDRQVIIFIIIFVVIGVAINFIEMDANIRKIINIAVVAICALLFIVSKFLPSL